MTDLLELLCEVILDCLFMNNKKRKKKEKE